MKRGELIFRVAAIRDQEFAFSYWAYDILSTIETAFRWFTTQLGKFKKLIKFEIMPEVGDWSLLQPVPPGYPYSLLGGLPPASIEEIVIWIGKMISKIKGEVPFFLIPQQLMVAETLKEFKDKEAQYFLLHNWLCTVLMETLLTQLSHVELSPVPDVLIGCSGKIFPFATVPLHFASMRAITEAPDFRVNRCILMTLCPRPENLLLHQICHLFSAKHTFSFSVMNPEFLRKTNWIDPLNRWRIKRTLKSLLKE